MCEIDVWQLGMLIGGKRVRTAEDACAYDED